MDSRSRSQDNLQNEGTPPHDHRHVLTQAHQSTKQELTWAIEAALDAQQAWAGLDWYQRAAIFHRAADLLAGPRRLEQIAVIMVNQSKTPFEAEIDLAELVDFWRFNAYYMQFLYEQQPDQAPGEIYRFDWRPLEGFVLAIPPFNFYSIGGNLATAPALAGNVILWKPSRSVLLANYRIMQVLEEAFKKVVSYIIGSPAMTGVSARSRFPTILYVSFACWRTRVGPVVTPAGAGGSPPQRHALASRHLAA